MREDEQLRSVSFFASNYNCCEMFYKMKKGIECKENEVELTTKASRLYESLKTLNKLSREEIIDIVGINTIFDYTSIISIFWS